MLMRYGAVVGELRGPQKEKAAPPSPVGAAIAGAGVGALAGGPLGAAVGAVLGYTLHRSTTATVSGSDIVAPPPPAQQQTSSGLELVPVQPTASELQTNGSLSAAEDPAKLVDRNKILRDDPSTIDRTFKALEAEATKRGIGAVTNKILASAAAAAAEAGTSVLTVALPAALTYFGPGFLASVMPGSPMTPQDVINMNPVSVLGKTATTMVDVFSSVFGGADAGATSHEYVPGVAAGTKQLTVGGETYLIGTQGGGAGQLLEDVAVSKQIAMGQAPSDVDSHVYDTETPVSQTNISPSTLSGTGIHVLISRPSRTNYKLADDDGF